jgi:hypothetical protein
MRGRFHGRQLSAVAAAVPGTMLEPGIAAVFLQATALISRAV